MLIEEQEDIENLLVFLAGTRIFTVSGTKGTKLVPAHTLMRNKGST
jgi:hypothetical protein